MSNAEAGIAVSVGSSQALEAHRLRAGAMRALAKRLLGQASKISLGMLAAFLGAVILGAAGISQGAAPLLALGGLALLTFFGLRLVHVRLSIRSVDAERRAAIHDRHLRRAEGRAAELEVPRSRLEGHPYAGDLDLLGPGSLLQRLDVSHTLLGERTLVAWLAAPAELPSIRARQVAVEELAGRLSFREDLEAAALSADEDEKLDATPFLSFVGRERFYEGRRWLIPILHLSPLLVLGLYWAGSLGLLPTPVWGVALVLQAALGLFGSRVAAAALDLVGARRGYVEAYGSALRVLETSRFDAPLLEQLRERVHIGGAPPSSYLARLDRWAGLAELRTQGPVHFVANVLLLWDLHVLLRLETWSQDIGGEIEQAFEALGELEALASLATLLSLDPGARMPEFGEDGAPLEAEGLAHPLLPLESRVANDLRLPGPASALVITGSNMAGKSTLLRALGLNVALALAGGPVIARRFSLPRLRLRASMRIDDSLQRGASYFHAELSRLRQVVGDAEGSPPVLFLLDELLRGTNARARHIGGRAVLKHLLDRGALGLVATHDIALSELEDERPGMV
ncbi:MAG: DNA mismatch repair protein MutS, partial [Myxococcales bacterium]|nr:DNA mismatch repair protein MutS [Myxococcales bacterium]